VRFRLARADDIEQLVDIYIERFPNRCAEVFGNRRTFIRDYLAFYLSWDPDGNWICADGTTVRGYLIAPIRYSPLKAMFQHRHLARWLLHLLGGRYGFPLPILRQFLLGGFAFNPHPAIQARWGKPYVHLIAVRAGNRYPGMALGLLRSVMESYEKKSVTYAWGLIPHWNRWVVDLYLRLGWRIDATLDNGDTIVAWGVPSG